MQFYIIHPDPLVSAHLLPDYALNKVNLREGWQILSDIGHILDVSWSGQNKLYSASHALTRSFCKDSRSFLNFLSHYESCLDEYSFRRGEDSPYANKYLIFIGSSVTCRTIQTRLPKDEYENNIRYLLKYKSDKISVDEKRKLTDKIKKS
jgi:hypothetical protein